MEAGELSPLRVGTPAQSLWGPPGDTSHARILTKQKATSSSPLRKPKETVLGDSTTSCKQTALDILTKSL